MTNRLSVGDTATIDEIAAVDIAAGTFTFENGLVKFYTHDVAAGASASPNVRDVRVFFDKATVTDTWDVGEEVQLDETNQIAVKTGGVRGGYCTRASSATDTQVECMLGE